MFRTHRERERGGGGRERRHYTPHPANRMRIFYPNPNCYFLMMCSEVRERWREGGREREHNIPHLAYRMRIFYPDPNCSFLTICLEVTEREKEREHNTPLPANRMRIFYPDPNCTFLVISTKFPERQIGGVKERITPLFQLTELEFFLIISANSQRENRRKKEREREYCPSYRMRIFHTDPNCFFLIIDTKFLDRERERGKEREHNTLIQPAER